MARIIGLTGAQGTGKTTLLKALTALNLPNIVVDGFSVPRSVQNDYGKSLQDIVSVVSNVPDYQDAILRRKMERMIHLWNKYRYVDDDVLVFTDRTPIDFYAYAKTWVNANPDYADWLVKYREDCKHELWQFNHVLYLPIRDFDFVSEEQRGSLETRHEVASNCMDFITSSDVPKLVYTITEVPVDERVAETLAFFNTVGSK